jgi:hypothetical protein
MATDPLTQSPQPEIFPAAKIPLLVHALAGPEGKGAISADDAASIRQIETNLAHYRNAN